MARTFQPRDFDLLGYRDPEVLQDAPGFAAYRATAPAGIETVEAVFIYLKAGITYEEVRQAARSRSKTGQNLVVYHSSLEPRIDRFKELLGRRHYFILEKLLWERLKTTFAHYVRTLEEGITPPSTYVTPHPEGRPNQNLEEVLLGWVSSTPANGVHSIQVVRAPAGIGKTSLARQLTSKLVSAMDKYRLIPVHVESEHWARVGVKSFEDLWAMISNSLRHFDENLHIPEGLFNHLLQSGDLVFVFDGFDELCGHGLSQFSPRDVLQHLIRLRAESAAKIVLTTRTMYWESEVGGAPAEAVVWDLAPFTKQQAADYLERRFSKKQATKKRAHALLDELRAANQPPTKGGGKKQISYHPYIVEMIASSAEERISEVVGSGPPWLMLRLLMGMCEREQARRKLVTNPDQQLIVFEDVALDCRRNGRQNFSEEDCVLAGFNEADKTRLKDHPLIRAEKEDSQQRLQFRYDFLSSVLIARYLVRTVKACSGRGDLLPKLALEVMEEQAEGTGALFDHMCDAWDPDPIDTIGRCAGKVGNEAPSATSFLFHLARAIHKSRRPSASKSERTEEVLALVGSDGYKLDRAIRGVCLHGTIDRFDLSGLTFESCTFVNAVFADCDVNETTGFRRCRFLGEFDVTGANKKAWGAIKEPHDCEMDIAARLEWDEIRSGKVNSRDQVARDAIKVALSKFWYHGRLKRTIAKHDWNKGVLGRLGIGSRLLKAMEKVSLLEDIHISGVPEGGFALADAGIRDVQQFMDNGLMTGKVRAVFELLL